MGSLASHEASDESLAAVSSEPLGDGAVTPYTDTPFVIPPRVVKSSQPIGDDPNFCKA